MDRLLTTSLVGDYASDSDSESESGEPGVSPEPSQATDRVVSGVHARQNDVTDADAKQNNETNADMPAKQSDETNANMPAVQRIDESPTPISRELARELRRSRASGVHDLDLVEVNAALMAQQRPTAAPSRPTSAPRRSAGISKAARRTHHITALAAAARAERSADSRRS